MAPKEKLRVPPQSLDSEKAVLGSIMLRPGSLIEIADRLSPDAFYSDKHKKIYEAMFELSAKNDPIDSVSLSHVLKEKKLLDAVGGARYLAELSNSVPSSTNAGYYADIVEQKYILRRLIDSADILAELGYNSGTKPLEDILDTAEKQIFALADSPKRAKYLTLKDTLGEAWTRLERLHETKGELRGVPTGYKALDDMLSGFQKSDLIILAARPSMGKTTLALDIARMTATKHNTAVGIFSLEMSSQQLVDRMLAAESRVNAWKLRTGGITAENDFQRVQHALDRLSKAPIYIDDQPSSSIVHIRSIARRLKTEHNVGLIIVDYLQLMTTSKDYDSMVNQVTEISRSLKALAREIDVPVIALSQLSRAVEARGGEPRLSDLRDSGSIEQDADVVMFIHREDKYDKNSDRPNIAKIMIEKHRNGPTGHVELYFDDKTTSFMPIEKGNMDDFAISASSKDADLDEF
ncbi:MAG: replicative DNA helicase [Candidatus Pacebacteria bacterium]|nr:replicative DNA helicase [Candidatus Paceibacterota bacterium]